MPDDVKTLSLYEQDFSAWALRQAEALRAAGQAVDHAGPASDGLPSAFHALDWDNLAEEIEGLARRDRRELESRSATIIEHLVKLECSPAADPRVGWMETIGRNRRKIAGVLRDSPSLRREIPALIEQNASDAIHLALDLLAARGETPTSTPRTDYTTEQVLGAWWPETVQANRPTGAPTTRTRKRPA